MRWLVVAIVLVCCAAMVGQANDVPPEFRLFADTDVIDVVTQHTADAPMPKEFNIFADSPSPAVAQVQPLVIPEEIEVEIWVRDQCPNCDQWFRNLKAEAASRRDGKLPAVQPRVRWVVRTDSPPKQVTAFPYWRFWIGGRVFEATGNTSAGGVIHDYRKWLSTFR